MPKQATKVVLSKQEEEELTKITKRHKSGQQQVLRSNIVLHAAKGYSNAKIARDLDTNVDTVRLWRDRWAGLQGVKLETLSVEDRLEDAPRPGRPSTITEEQKCKMSVIACEAPLKSGRPISQWSGREIADEVKAQGIVEQISPRHAARLIKKKGLKPHTFRYWLREVEDEQREEKIKEGCELYAKAADRAKQGERTISLDEMTGVQALERKQPDLPMQPISPEAPKGRVLYQEFEYIRHGTLSCIINLDVATRKVICPSCGFTRNEADMAIHIKRLIESDPDAIKWRVIMDNLNTHQVSKRWFGSLPRCKE
jgi:transposase